MPTLREIMQSRSRRGGAATPSSPSAEEKAPTISKSSEPAVPDRQPEPRPLCKATEGEVVPMRFPKEGDPTDTAWHACLWEHETALGVVIEPGETADHAWLAIRRANQREVILVHRLPLIHRARGDDPY